MTFFLISLAPSMIYLKYTMIYILIKYKMKELILSGR